jgi:hypothetical protein
MGINFYGHFFQKTIEERGKGSNFVQFGTPPLVLLSFLEIILQIFNIAKLEKKKNLAWVPSYQFFSPTHYYYY